MIPYIGSAISIEINFAFCGINVLVIFTLIVFLISTSMLKVFPLSPLLLSWILVLSVLMLSFVMPIALQPTLEVPPCATKAFLWILASWFNSLLILPA